MQKTIYLLLALLTTTPSMATQSVTNNLIVASTLVLSNTNSNRTFNKKLSLDLHKAIENKDYTSVKSLITNPKVDVNAKVDYNTQPYPIPGYTPLMRCSSNGDQWLAIAKLLLRRKDINVNLGNNYGYRPLITCCWKGDEALEIAKLLLGHKGIAINLKSKNRKTPLDIIVHRIVNSNKPYKPVNLWNVLVGKGAVLHDYIHIYQNLNSKNYKEPQKSYIKSIISNPPIHIKPQSSTEDNNLIRKQVSVLKKKKYSKRKVNKKPNIKFTDFYQAIDQGNYTLAARLIKRTRMNVNLQDNLYGYTPLIHCCREGDKALKTNTET